MKSVSVQEFRRACREGWRPQLVDVRSATEFAAGHVPGAVNIPLPELEGRQGDLDRSAPLVLVSQNGARAELAAQRLAGYRNVTLLSGGTAAWAKAGLPLVVCRSTRWSIERQARLVVGMIMLLTLALAAFVNKGWMVVPAVMGFGLFVAGLSDVCFMGVVMGRMPWNKTPCQPESDDLNREATEVPAS